MYIYLDKLRKWCQVRGHEIGIRRTMDEEKVSTITRQGGSISLVAEEIWPHHPQGRIRWDNRRLLTRLAEHSLPKEPNVCRPGKAIAPNENAKAATSPLRQDALWNLRDLLPRAKDDLWK